ncbi:MAG: NADH-ubiquinone oxidoreductase-F iron-sulfur binding region domain-containing protein [Patescibacteria group bacterium]|nr:NADH-ubiquinone oxidoreductase-F iron-sulfur binding region domain-containing protein [Patescibacteria group bacterium]
MNINIISKIKKAGLVGRGGACFPAATKWGMVKKAAGDKKYIICNASEGEPGVKKDGYILEHYPERVIDGIKVAIDFLGAKKGIIYINYKYYKKFAKKLKKLIGNSPIELFIKPISSGYIGGEETSAINAIEGKLVEPKLQPSFPTTNGLWGCPTLVNNVETFYDISKIQAGEYENKRFYTVSGDCLWAGVYELPEDWTIEKVLKQTKNMPKFAFFAQIGGNASGEVLNDKQLKRQVSGAGSITVYSIKKCRPKKLITGWLNFFLNESCGQCAPCREGIYRLIEIIKSPKPNWQLFNDLLNNLDETSFCGLGRAAPVPIRSYVRNVLNDPHKSTNLFTNLQIVI